MAVYITGDCHGQFDHIENFCDRMKTTREDTMIILGDAGILYYGTDRDDKLVKRLDKFPIKFFVIRGNHEMNASHHPDCERVQSADHNVAGTVFRHKLSENIQFAINGNQYVVDGIPCAVCGGAYSVDKYYRIFNIGCSWFYDEQPDAEERRRMECNISEVKPVAILTHTCPARFIPREMFLTGINQKSVDNRTEDWLDEVYSTVSESDQFERWYCGHYHTDKAIDKIHFLFNTIELFMQ